MAQNSPLRNRAPIQGPMRPPGFTDADGWTRSDRMAFDQGRRAIGSAPPPPPPPPAAPAASAPAASAPPRPRAGGKWGGRVGGVLAVGNEVRHLAEVGADGRDAVYAELPRSAGRLGGMWAGAKTLGAAGTALGGPWGGAAGSLLGGGLGYAYGDDAVDAVAPRITEAAGRMRYASRDPKHYTDPAFQATAADVAARPAEVSPARNRVGTDWRAPMQLPAGSQPEGWSLKPVVPDGMPKDWRAPQKLPSDYPGAPESPAPARDPAAEAAMRYASAPDVVQAAGAQDANKAEAAGVRSAARIQDYGANARSTITGNMLDGMRGDTAELQRRMYNDLTSYSLKGFPALRAQRAEMWNNAINSANGVTAKGADNAAAADMQGMRDANESQRAFSDRRNKVDMFNVDTSEKRRTGDLDRAVTREGNMLRAQARGARGGDKYADPSFAGKLYEDYLKVYKDPALAVQMAARGAVAAGDTADSPVMSMAQAMDADNLQRGMRAHADGYFGFGNDAFDPKTAQPVAEADWTDSWLPGGVDTGDIKLRDAQGNETWAARSTALPTGEDFTSFSQRLARQRELARLRNGGK